MSSKALDIDIQTCLWQPVHRLLCSGASTLLWAASSPSRRYQHGECDYPTETMRPSNKLGQCRSRARYQDEMEVLWTHSYTSHNNNMLIHTKRCVHSSCAGHSWAIWKDRFILKVTEFLWKWYFLLFLHLRNVQWKAAAEMLNSSFSKTARWVTVHYIILELKESRTKTHFHNFGGINVHAMPQYLQCMFLATTFTVFLKSKVNQQSIALYFSFYWSLQWRCQNIVSRVRDTSRFRRVINQMESN